MIKSEQPIEEVNALLFDDEDQEFDSTALQGTQQQKTEPRLLKQKELLTELEKLEPVPYYKRPVVQATALLVFAIPIGWLLISAFSPGETSNPQHQSVNHSEDRENQLLKDSLNQERKKNQDLSIENGLKTQRMEVIPVKPKPIQQPTPRPAVVQSEPSPAPLRVSTLPRTVPRPVSYASPHRPLVPATPKPLVPATPKPLAPANVEPKLDPMKQWLAAANVGSYGSILPDSDATQTADTPSDEELSTYFEDTATNLTESQPQTREKPAQHGGDPYTAQITDNPRATVEEGPPRAERFNAWTSEPQTSQPENNYQRATYFPNPSNLIRVGTRVSGKLDTPIRWSGNSSQNLGLPDLLIELVEPLKAADGSEAIPAGSYLTVRVSSADTAGILQLSPVSVQFSNGRTEPLPEGAIWVFDKKGNTLQAKFHAPGAGKSFLSELGDAAGIAGLATDNSSLYVLNALGNRPRPQSRPTYFSLEKGTSVEIYVKQSFSL